MPNYTNYGWYTSTVIPGRATDIAPPDASTTTTPGQPRANWDGRGWVMQPYVTEPKPVAPLPLPPSSVAMCQFRLALLGAGLLAKANSEIAALTGLQGDATRVEWEFLTEIDRQQPMVVALGPPLGLSPAQIDALFIAASAL